MLSLAFSWQNETTLLVLDNAHWWNDIIWNLSVTIRASTFQFPRFYAIQFTQSHQPYMYESESLFLKQSVFPNPYHAAFSNGASIRIVCPLDRCTVRMPLVPIPLSFRSAGIVCSVVHYLVNSASTDTGTRNHAPKKHLNKPSATFRKLCSLNLSN